MTRRRSQLEGPTPAPPPTLDPTAHPKRRFAPWVVGVALAAYVVLYFSVPSHRASLAYLLIPDEVLTSILGSGEMPVVFGDRLPILGLALVQAALCWGSGSLLLRTLGLAERCNVRERVAWAGFAGANLLSTWTLLVGWLWGLAPRLPLVGPLVITAAAGILLELQAALRARQRAKQVDSRTSTNDPEIATGTSEVYAADRGARWKASRWSFVLIPFATCLLLGSMLPPWEFDVLEYHLQVPKEWWQAGRVSFLPHNVYGNMPLGAEMQSLFSMTLVGGEDGWWRGALVGKTLTGTGAVLLAIGIWGIGARCYSERAGAIAAAIFLATPWVAHVSMAGLIDVMLGAYVFLAVVAWWRGIEDARENAGDPRRWLLLAGFLAGGAAACKYPGVVFAVIPLAAATCVVNVGRTFAWKQRVAWVTLLLAGSFVGGGGWYVKNFVVSGNPVYPLLYSVFGGESRNDEKDAQWRRAHRPGGENGRAYSFTTLSSSVAQVGWTSTWQGPLVVPFFLASLIPVTLLPIPAGSAERLGRRSLRGGGPWVAFVAWGLVVWWLATHRIDRFWIPLLPLAALAAGWGYERLRGVVGGTTVTLYAAAAFVIQLLVVATPGTVDERLGDNRFLAPLERLRELATPPAYVHVDRQIAEGERMLMIGEARPFYLRSPAVYSTCFDDCPYDAIFEGTTIDQQRAALAERRIAFIYVNWLEIDRYRSPGNYGYSSPIQRESFERELVAMHRLLRPISLPLEQALLFEVTPTRQKPRD